MPLTVVYHHVTPSLEEDLNTTSEGLLKAQITRFLRAGYRICSVKEAISKPSDEKTLAMTFDDGYRSFHSVVLPILESKDISTTVFLVSGCLDGSAEMPYDTMTRAEAKEVAASGMEIGSHGRLHRHLTKLHRKDLENELSNSKADIADFLGVEVNGLSYPFGAVNGKVAEATKAAGYEYACASSILPFNDIVRPSKFMIPRIDVSRRSPDLALAMARTSTAILMGESARSFRFKRKHRA